ncbi:MAG: phage holin family protein [Eubacteriales bacterium]|nr:phage holin family protein [Eubacteriales bacterium]
MNIFEQKINYAVSMIVGVLSAILGKFWFLFVFLLALNILDYITGILKARYLHTESSKKAMKGFVKKVLIWCLVALGFGLSIIFEQIGVVIGKNLSIMQCIGWFILTHCIINEIRSILENMVQMDKDNLIPNWLIRGLEVARNKFDIKAEQFVDKFDNGGNKDEDK